MGGSRARLSSQPQMIMAMKACQPPWLNTPIQIGGVSRVTRDDTWLNSPAAAAPLRGSATTAGSTARVKALAPPVASSQTQSETISSGNPVAGRNSTTPAIEPTAARPR